MIENSDRARITARKVRGVVLLSTALGCTIGIVGTAAAQNISSTNNITDYSLTETGTRSGGPRTVDIATSGGAISIDEGTVNVDNNPANNPGNVTGAGSRRTTPAPAPSRSAPPTSPPRAPA